MAAHDHSHDHDHHGHAATGQAHHGHDHAGGHHDHTAGVGTRPLTIALALSSTVLVVELAGALMFNSLALLSDAAHMLTDVAALAIALMAIRIGRRRADDRRTFGYKRFEILAAAFNALMMFVASAYVLIEAIGRFRSPEPIAAGGMLIVAIVGLAANLIAMRVLLAGRGESLAMKGAYLEVWADAIGSLGVIAAAVVIRFTGWLWLDPIVAIGIALWILPRTWSLLRDTTNVLLEGVPRGLVLADIRSAIEGQAGVRDVHDLHVWSMSTKDVNATVHVALDPQADGEAVRHAVAALLETRFGIGHATIQVEREVCGVAVMHQ